MGGVLCLYVGDRCAWRPPAAPRLQGVGLTAGACHLYRLFMCITAVCLAVPQKPKLTPLRHTRTSYLGTARSGPDRLVLVAPQPLITTPLPDPSVDGPPAASGGWG